MRRAAIEEQDRHLLERQRRFRAAADLVSKAWTAFPEVEAIAVIGAVAKVLWKEIPRFSEFRREGIKVWHECADLDLAVWLSSQERLGSLRLAAALILRTAEESGLGLGVVPHHLDAFMFEPGTNRYLGRLCSYNECPKGKRACLVPGCGAIPFNKVVEDFTPYPDLLDGVERAMLYRRGVGRLRSALDLPMVPSA